MSAYQGRTWETIVYLELAGVPAIGLAAGDVEVVYRKAGETAFSPRTLQPSEFIELGDGFYVIVWPISFMDKLGTFFYTLNSDGFDNFLSDQFDVGPVPLTLAAPPEVCIVSGNIMSLGGQPGQSQKIAFRVAKVPAVAGSSLVAVDRVNTIPDALGNFSVMLLRGAVVLVEIDQVGVKNQITIPDQPSAAILDLLPPIP